MPNINEVHYVKFIRGSLSAWELLLETPAKISDDTLYFIYENAQNPRKGKLYLGQKLISGDGTSGEVINIEDLANINIDDSTLENKQILVYNEANYQWENTSLSTIINTAVGEMVGASAAAAGASGLVPAPQAGDQDKFLRGDKTWATIGISSFDTNVFEKDNTTQKISLKGFKIAENRTYLMKDIDGEISWVTNPGSGNLSREIVTLEQLQQKVANNTYDTNTIYMVQVSDDQLSTDRYDEYIVVSSKIERLGSFGGNVDLNNYVTKTVFQTAIQNINDILNDTTDASTGNLVPGVVTKLTVVENIVQTKIGNLDLILSQECPTLVDKISSMDLEIEGLNNRLQWHELETNE